jgi:hypothetical protein
MTTMRDSRYILLSDAGSHFPHPPAYSTLRRYASTGLHGVRLRTVQSAGRRLTTREWIDEFVLISSGHGIGSCYDLERRPTQADSVRRLKRAGIELSYPELRPSSGSQGMLSGLPSCGTAADRSWRSDRGETDQNETAAAEISTAAAYTARPST